ncbi:MAG: magnesium/cobalt efflux protein [Treponema sp.]|nr:MAG: magnesium/cobalt efflux protein [Treponema sp.]
MGIFKFFRSKKDLVHSLGEKMDEEMEDMIEGVVALSDTTVKEIMIPRIDVDFLATDNDSETLIEKIVESGHSRFPVYEESIDNVVGMLYIKDILKKLTKNEPIDFMSILRKPFFVPESKRIDSLLREFKRKHIHIAVAIDEYGGVSGIVCMEDIIEEIVGDIKDEFDDEPEDIVEIGDGVWLCDARVDLDDLDETCETKFPANDFDSLGGFVFDLFGKIPSKFEKRSWKNFDFIIQEMDGHKILSVKIIKHKEKFTDESEK